MSLDNVKDSTVNTGYERNQAYIEDESYKKLVEDGVDITREHIKQAFDVMWDMICHELEEGNMVKLHGKGQFYISDRAEREGRNPSTGETHMIAARQAMAFRVSQAYSKRFANIRKEKAGK